jgi:hypothetical protein
MKEKLKSYVVDSSTTCSVCGGMSQEIVIELPNLPLTDTFCKVPMNDPYGALDQSLLYCSECSHAQLLNIVKPDILYGDRYHFRTSVSVTARKGANHFINFLRTLFPGKVYSTALDIGCNDLYLLNQLKPFVKQCIGVDPIWAGKEKEVSDEIIRVFGCCIEDIEAQEISSFAPELIVCRHTIEHIANPMEVLCGLLDSARDDAVFLFEFPAFEPLVERHRFDHIFHQHLHYFSLASFRRLIDECGGCYIAHTWNYHDWGALLVAFSKNKARNSVECKTKIDIESIKRSHKLFCDQFLTTSDVLNSLKETCIYGYGAAQMLPVISYHLKNDLSCLECVLDDDPSKEGLSYWNLPVNVHHSSKVRDIEQSAVFITAIDNLKPILCNLFELKPKHIIYPLHVL